MEDSQRGQVIYKLQNVNIELSNPAARFLTGIDFKNTSASS